MTTEARARASRAGLGLGSAIVSIAVVASARDTGANPDVPDLQIRQAPTPRTLRMRSAQVEPPPADDAAPDDAAVDDGDPDTATAVRRRRPAEDDAAAIRSASDIVTFRLDLGFGVDGAAISGRRALAGAPLDRAGYQPVRAQGFGNLFAGTRGLVFQPLSTYLSLGFRLTPALPGNVIAPLPDVLDRTEDLQARIGWAEASGFLPGRFWEPIRIRAGRQYVYAPWPIHFDGLVAAWTTRAIQVTFLAGTRVKDFEPQNDATERAATTMAALTVAVDLGVIGKRPITLRGAFMGYGDRRFSDLELGYRPRRGLSFVASSRSIDQELARERATLRVQVSDTTNVVADFQHRHDNDWRWDPAYVKPQDDLDPTDDIGEAREYFDLGPTIPQLRGSLRAGTVLLDNVDVFLRGALAVDLVDRPSETTGYFEVGGAVEVRLRRAVALTASGLVRDNELTDTTPIVDLADMPQVLPDRTDSDTRSRLGEESFIEGGSGLRVSIGARTFSASGELYFRRSRYAELYREDSPGIGDELVLVDVRGGGRFGIDAWMNRRVRFHLEYDLSTQLDRAPEITGWKSLRALVEGSF